MVSTFRRNPYTFHFRLVKLSAFPAPPLSITGEKEKTRRRFSNMPDLPPRDLRVYFALLLK